jgi:hypothetical protein
MSGNSASAPAPTPAVVQPKKTKVEQAHSYLALVSTAIGVLGALGTGFVWVSTTFFLGDVHINPDKPIDALTIKVFDKRGQASNYLGKDVQLMPGKYRVEISRADGSGPQTADVNVQLWKVATIPYAVPSTEMKPGDPSLTATDPASGYDNASASNNASASDNASDGSGDAMRRQSYDKKHWWQFWKKSQ